MVCTTPLYQTSPPHRSPKLTCLCHKTGFNSKIVNTITKQAFAKKVCVEHYKWLPHVCSGWLTLQNWMEFLFFIFYFKTCDQNQLQFKQQILPTWQTSCRFSSRSQIELYIPEVSVVCSALQMWSLGSILTPSKTYQTWDGISSQLVISVRQSLRSLSQVSPKGFPDERFSVVSLFCNETCFQVFKNKTNTTTLNPCRPWSMARCQMHWSTINGTGMHRSSCENSWPFLDSCETCSFDFVR